jgi:hypothetical protein
MVCGWGGGVARVRFLFFFSFFLSLKEKRILKHNVASRVFETDGLKDNTPTAEEMDGTRCTKKLMFVFLALQPIVVVFSTAQ